MTAEESLELGRVARPRTRRHVLCLSGGGYRGLYTAAVLEELEQRAGDGLGTFFDVVAGTSIGAVIAAGVALDVPVARIRQAIERRGPEVFDARLRLGRKRLPVRNRLRALYRARYAQRPLREVIEEVFGATANKPLSKIGKPLAVCAVQIDQSSPRILVSRGLSTSGASDMALKDALLSTTAAPTYFPTHRVRERLYVDGGLIANAPDLVAVAETLRRFGCRLEDVWALSVGTAAAAHRAPRSARGAGLLEWIVWKGLVQMTLSAQEQLAVDQCGVLLADRYVRVDHPTAESDRRHLRLDSASEESTRILRCAARATVDSLNLGKPDISWVFRHRAADDARDRRSVFGQPEAP